MWIGSTQATLLQNATPLSQMKTTSPNQKGRIWMITRMLAQQQQQRMNSTTCNETYCIMNRTRADSLTKVVKLSLALRFCDLI